VSVYLRNTTRRHRLNLRGLSRATRTLLGAAGRPEASVSLSFVGDAAIRRLNRDYRGKDRPTDVLSFSVDGNPERLLGDIVISLDAAERQAAAYAASLDAEVRRLLIHGVLHLLGHDHARPAEAARMRAEERRLASAIGLEWPYEPSE
jgi:probable rRNA maturation factor